MDPTHRKDALSNTEADCELIGLRDEEDGDLSRRTNAVGAEPNIFEGIGDYRRQFDANFIFAVATALNTDNPVLARLRASMLYLPHDTVAAVFAGCKLKLRTDVALAFMVLLNATAFLKANGMLRRLFSREKRARAREHLHMYELTRQALDTCTDPEAGRKFADEYLKNLRATMKNGVNE